MQRRVGKFFIEFLLPGMAGTEALERSDDHAPLAPDPPRPIGVQ